MDLGLEGRVALVTGASRGIGRGIAERLATEGARVAVTSRDPERIAAAANEIGAELALVHDMGDVDRAAELVAQVADGLGPIDVCVLNTGGPPAGADALAFPREQWQAAYRNLVLGPMALVEQLVPGMRSRGFGRVLSVASTAAREPIDNLMLSSTHRSALALGLKTIARQVASDGVTLNTLLSGRIDTERLAELYGSRDAAVAAAREQVPARRLGAVEEIAAVAAFLCSQPAAYVTGTAVAVDGGLMRGL